MKTHWRLVFEQSFAEKVLKVIDSQIDQIYCEADTSLDPDSVGYYD